MGMENTRSRDSDRAAKAERAWAVRSARRQAPARGGEPSGPLRNKSPGLSDRRELCPWPEVANAWGTARQGWPRGWDREREEATTRHLADERRETAAF